ncbi:MAG: hypothetical protein JJT93_05225 [Gammaproteobacteria bacterium]|nr:hypothetical protein [Gammaproteobacteria bacterium]TVQ43972.1 MAG: hypothetical protein EA371_14140 [Gammaproteobacteria bacterium]
MDERDRQTLSLRQQVEQRLPGWRSWYPSIFAAAEDLGLIRARVCPPGQLMLSARHAGVRNDAEQHHRDRWGGLEEELHTGDGPPPAPSGSGRRGRRKRR